MHLAVAAPTLPRLLVWPVAQLLASEAGPDVLLIVADALEELAREHQVFGSAMTCAALQRLAGVLRDEAPRRA